MTEDYILKKSKIIQNIHNIMNNDNNDIQSYLLSIIDTLSDKKINLKDNLEKKIKPPI